nr:MAG TPA: hypothetical protein [Caudoviricetes sp.]
MEYCSAISLFNVALYAYEEILMNHKLSHICSTHCVIQ